MSAVSIPLPVEAIQIVKRRKVRTLGGPGSGNFGHAGRPGEVGGSAPGNTNRLPGLLDAYDPKYHDAIRQMHDTLMKKSFFADDKREALTVIYENGQVSNEILVGDIDSVPIPSHSNLEWRNKKAVVVAHTHPYSGAPSSDDLSVQWHNNIPNQIVFGEDGSWYEIKMSSQLNVEEFRLAHSAYYKSYLNAAERAKERTNQWFAERTGFKRDGQVFEVPGTGKVFLQSDNDDLIRRTVGTDKFRDQHYKYWADESVSIWQEVSKQVPKIQYRYYRP